MPAIETNPPELGTYSFVLARSDRALQEHAIAVICYTGQYDSRFVEFRGARVHAIFVNLETERDFAQKRGWTDVTEEWFLEHRTLPAVALALRSLASPSVPAAVAKVAGLPTHEVARALPLLEARGLAVQRGTGSIKVWSAPPPVAPAPPAPEGEGAQAGA